MSHDELNVYLQGLLVESEEVMDMNVDDSCYSMKDSLVEYLKENYKKLGKKTKSLLRDHGGFGKELKKCAKHLCRIKRNGTLLTNGRNGL